MENCEAVYAEVKIRSDNALVTIPVTSRAKPQITSAMKEKWQKIIDITAKCMNVPAALIMEIREHEISVLVSSRTLDNPYSVGSSEDLRCGLYCETVLGKDSPLYIADAMDSAYWCDNPDIKLGMKSYLGFPVKWPDGEFFGTICVLDSIENPYMQGYAELMVLVQDIVERDLEQILLRISESVSGYSALINKIEILTREREDLREQINIKKRFIEKIYGPIKNGLEVLSACTGIKSEDCSKDSAMLMIDMKARVDNLICVLSSIYNTEGISPVPIGNCIRDWVERIKTDYASECANIAFGIDAPDSILIDAEQAFCCEMIITEALINSIRYAFKNKMNGEIYIMMREIRPGEYMLHISDNGTGISMERNSKGFGMELINGFVKKLNGVIHVERVKGTSYYIDFKKNHKCEDPYLI